MPEKSLPADIKKLSFEEALEELEEIVSTLEQGSNKLDEAVKSFERGTLLKLHCEAKLKDARDRIEKISIGSDGEAGVEPADID